MLSKKKIAVSFLSPTKQLSDEIHAEELGDQIREDKVFLPCPLLFCIRARRRVLSMYSIYPGGLYTLSGSHRTSVPRSSNPLLSPTLFPPSRKYFPQLLDR